MAKLKETIDTVLKRVPFKISAGHVKVNDMYVKTLLIKDFPEDCTTGLIKVFTEGRHVVPGVVINFAFHFRPSALTFDNSMNHKLNRLQRNIQSNDAGTTGRITDKARDEEVKALRSLIYLRDNVNQYIDVWVTISFSSTSKKLVYKSVKDFKDAIRFRGWETIDLEKEQHRALDAAWMGGSDRNSIFERYPGRVMDMNAIAALYPYLNGSISEPNGDYLAHRIVDSTAVYKNFTAAVTDTESMMITGMAGSGKSTLIKTLVISLLMNNYKGYIFDANGEYAPLKDIDGAVLVDFSVGNGFFVDPTIIESSLISELPKGRFSKNSYEYELALDADRKRFDEAHENTFAIVSLLSDDFSKEKQNALDEALMEMWSEAGIVREDPKTWDIRKPEVGLHPLFQRIKQGKSKGAKGLYEDMKMYFEGGRKYVFAKATSGDWIRDARLVIFNLSSAVDNVGDKRLNAIKIILVNHMVWQRIKRDRILKERYSFEVKDELQRAINNPNDLPYLLRSVTDCRKFNDQVIMGFNNPAILFKEGFTEGEAIWENTKYKLFFHLEERAIRNLAKNANMPDEVVAHWLSLPRHSFIFSQKDGGQTSYDMLSTAVPKEEIERFAKTRGLD